MVPDQLLPSQIRVLVEAVEALTFELVPNFHVDAVEDVLMNFGILQDLDGLRVDMLDVVIGICGSFNVEEQSVVPDLAIETLLCGNPVQVGFGFALLNRR